MTQEQFIHWLKGFVEGIQEHHITPMQWDIVKGKLSEVNDKPSYNTHPPYVDGKGHPNPYYFTTTTFGRNDVTSADTDSTPTSVKQLLTDNHD